MAHVKITHGDDSRSLRLIVDGVDWSDRVYDEGFGIVRIGDGLDQVWGVQVVIAPDVLEVDLPDATVVAQRKQVG